MSGGTRTPSANGIPPFGSPYRVSPANPGPAKSQPAAPLNGKLIAMNSSLTDITAEQLYEACLKAIQKIDPQHISLPWSSASSGLAGVYATVASRLNLRAMLFVGGHPTTEELATYFQLAGLLLSGKDLAALAELTSNWTGYFGIEAPTESDHKVGDVWLFKAGGSKAKVVDVAPDGKVKLRLNGIETEWLEVSELEKDAKKQ